MRSIFKQCFNNPKQLTKSRYMTVKIYVFHKKRETHSYGTIKLLRQIAPGIYNYHMQSHLLHKYLDHNGLIVRAF
jgi:hypothetical protein